jgi:hypothetical protein
MSRRAIICREVESDLGPVSYLSALIGVPDAIVMRWFILAVALILDPAAVMLLLAASTRLPLVTTNPIVPKCRADLRQIEHSTFGVIDPWP